MTLKKTFSRAVYVVDGCRTPFLKAHYTPGPLRAADLGVAAAQAVMYRCHIDPQTIEEVIMGCVMPAPTEVNIGRLIAVRAGCDVSTPAWTVQRNCASGLQAVDSAAQSIAQGRADLVLAGGCEAMSYAPLLYHTQVVKHLMAWQRARSLKHKLAALQGFKWRYLKPVSALLQGLCDPLIDLSMGQTAEHLAHRFAITREQMDAYANQSHRKAHAARTQLAQEIAPLYLPDGSTCSHDTGVRSDSDMAALAALSPVFDRPYGQVTAGNSSQISDGAACVLLASQAAVKKYKLKPLAQIIDIQWAALSPVLMGLGPIHAATQVLQRQALSVKEIDYWEINEAFAAQVLACLAAWQDASYCKAQLGLSAAVNTDTIKKTLNTAGGAIALGHPVGASGARLVLHLAHLLAEKDAQRGIVSLCIGGGQGGAILLQRVVK